MNHMSSPVLILNASFEPLNISPAQRAMKLLFKEAARIEVIHESEHEIRPGWPLPSVVRLLYFAKVPHKTVTCTRQGIIARDENTCQYCGRILSTKSLTLDHVHPKSRGGRATWQNLVACCRDCNRRKADRTPEEAGMILLNIPREVTINTQRHSIRKMGRDNPAWRKYLYFDTDVEAGRVLIH